MTSDAIAVIKMLFNTAYTFFTSFVIPGTIGVTPLLLLLFATFSVLAVKFLRYMLIPR